MLKKLVTGGILLAAAMMLCGWKIAAAGGPLPAEKMDDGLGGAGQTMIANDRFARIVARAGGAGNADELQKQLENDRLVQEAGLMPGSDITVSGVYAGECYLTPLLCLYQSNTPDLRCVYDCIGLRGTGEVTSRQLEECDFLAGCILFENCLAVCIPIISHDLQPVIWW